jgi:ERCC4-type nuclease
MFFGVTCLKGRRSPGVDMTVTIKIDTREQSPYEFKTPSEVGKLDAGDYSIVGLEDCVAIERKTVDDLTGCLTHDRDRFERELFRGKALDYFALVVEASLSAIAGAEYRSKVKPRSVVQSLLTFSIRYDLPVFFADTRAYGARLTESLLLKYVREIEKRFKQCQG